MASVRVMVVAVVALALVGESVMGQAPPCRGDISQLLTRCTPYVLKPGPITDPSPSCCDAVKNADIPCLCTKISGEQQAVLDMNKVVHVADICGTPLAHGSKCGSFTVPLSFS